MYKAPALMLINGWCWHVGECHETEVGANDGGLTILSLVRLRTDFFTFQWMRP
jgi:hypothetical protein